MIARFLHCVHHRLSSAAFRYMPLMTTLPGDDETGECNGAAQQRTTSALKSNGSYDRWKTLCIRTIILFVTLALLLWLLFGLPSSIVKWFPKTFDGLEYGDLFKPIHSTATATEEHDVENSSSNKGNHILNHSKKTKYNFP